MPTEYEFDLVENYTDLVTASVSASEMCKKLVHSKLSGNQTVGAQLLAIDNQARFGLVGSYGKTVQFGSLSVWDEHPFSETVRNGETNHVSHQEPDGSEVKILAIPLLKGQEPVGLMAVVSNPSASEPPFGKVSTLALKTLSKITALWLDSLGLAKSSGSFSTQSGGFEQASPETLTSRQMLILQGLADGKTNAQIAQEMILSESTIRQETVKIFRALGVHGRAEAAKRAIHLGLILKAAI